MRPPLLEGKLGSRAEHFSGRVDHRFPTQDVFNIVAYVEALRLCLSEQASFYVGWHFKGQRHKRLLPILSQGRAHNLRSCGASHDAP